MLVYYVSWNKVTKVFSNYLLGRNIVGIETANCLASAKRAETFGLTTEDIMSSSRHSSQFQNLAENVGVSVISFCIFDPFLF